MGFEPTTFCLEGRSSTTELRPHSPDFFSLKVAQGAELLSYARKTQNWWAEKDSNLRRREPPDLQSGPFGRLGICPRIQYCGGSARLASSLPLNFTPREPFWARVAVKPYSSSRAKRAHFKLTFYTPKCA